MSLSVSKLLLCLFIQFRSVSCAPCPGTAKEGMLYTFSHKVDTYTRFEWSKKFQNEVGIVAFCMHEPKPICEGTYVDHIANVVKLDGGGFNMTYTITNVSRFVDEHMWFWGDTNDNGTTILGQCKLEVNYLPKTSMKNCPSGVDLINGYIEAGTKTVTCQCELTNAGNPPGRPQWVNSNGESVEQYFGNRTSILTLIFDKNDPTPAYTCRGISNLGTEDGTTFTPKFAYGPESINSDSISTQFLDVYDKPLTPLDWCNPSDHFYVRYTIPKAVVQPKPLVFLEVADVESTVSEYTDTMTNSSYINKFRVNPKSGGRMSLTYNVSNSIFPEWNLLKRDWFSIDDQSVLAQLEIVNGQISPDGKLGYVTQGETIKLRCNVKGRKTPPVSTITIKCQDGETETEVNEAIMDVRVTKEMNAKSCTCTAVELSTCPIESTSITLKVQGACIQPVQEGSQYIFSHIVDTFEFYKWSVIEDSQVIVRGYCKQASEPNCHTNSDDGEYIAEAEALAGGGFNMSFTIKNVSPMDDATMWYWSDKAEDGTFIQVGDCNLEVYSFANTPMCDPIEVTGHSLSFVSWNCSISNVYPTPLCQFEYSKDGGDYNNTVSSNDINKDTPISKMDPVYKDIPVLYSRECTMNASVSSFGPGRYKFRVTMYPNMTDLSQQTSQSLGTSIKSSELTFVLPKTSMKNCPSGVDLYNGFIKAGTKTVTCQCELTNAGNPPGRPQWVKSNGESVEQDFGNGASILTLIFDKNDPNPTYTCRGISNLGAEDGTAFTPMFAHGPDKENPENIISMRIMNSNDEPITYLKKCNREDEFYVRYDTPKTAVNPEPQASLEIDGVDSKIAQVDYNSDDGIYKFKYSVNPKSGGEIMLNYTLSNYIMPELKVQDKRSITVFAAPSTGPILVVSGLSSPDGKINYYFLHEEEIQVRCYASGGYPPVTTITIQCPDGQTDTADNEAIVKFRVKKDMNGKSCTCTAVHKSTCPIQTNSFTMNVHGSCTRPVKEGSNHTFWHTVDTYTDFSWEMDYENAVELVAYCRRTPKPHCIQDYDWHVVKVEELDGGGFNMSYTITNVTIPMDGITWYWSDSTDNGTEIEFGNCRLDVYSFESNPTCDPIEVIITGSSMSFVSWNCNISHVYPTPLCQFEYSIDGGDYINTVSSNDINKDTTTSKMDPVFKTRPLAYSSECTMNASVSSFGTGKYKFRVIMYPNMTDLSQQTAQSLGTSIESSELTFDGPDKENPKNIISMRIMNSNDEPITYLNKCNRDDEFYVRYDTPKTAVNPEPQASLEIDGVDSKIAQVDYNSDDGIYTFKYSVNPKSGGEIMLTYNLSNSVMPELKVENKGSFPVYAPPTADPILLISGVSSPDGKINYYFLHDEEIQVRCYVSGGYPPVTTITIQCPDGQTDTADNEAIVKFRVKKDMNGKSCTCTAVHKSTCPIQTNSFTMNVHGSCTRPVKEGSNHTFWHTVDTYTDFSWEMDYENAVELVAYCRRTPKPHCIQDYDWHVVKVEELDGGGFNMSYTITNVTIPMDGITWYWSDSTDNGTETEFGNCRLDVYSFESNPTCDPIEVIVTGSSMSFVSWNCNISHVYPTPLCQFEYSIDGGDYNNTVSSNDINKDTPISKMDPVYKDIPVLYSRECTMNASVSSFGPGRYKFRVTMYPNMTDLFQQTSQSLGTSIESSELTFGRRDDSSKNSGLTVGETVGIAISGVMVAILLVVVVVFIMRKRRRGSDGTTNSSMMLNSSVFNYSNETARQSLQDSMY